MEQEFSKFEVAKNEEGSEKINFNTIDDEEDDLDMLKQTHSKAVMEVFSQEDSKAYEVPPINKHSMDRSSTIMLSEEAEMAAHEYVGGMIKSLKQQKQAINASNVNKMSLNYYPKESFDNPNQNYK